MRTPKALSLILSASLIAFVLSSCEKEGPAERAGKKIDKAVEQVGKKVDKTVEQTSDAMKKAKDKAQEAAQ